MNTIEDLNIKNDVLPLFDYTLNLFTKSKLIELVNTPLCSEDEILRRQEILKGFVANYSVLKDYNYTFLYFNQVYTFLNEDNFQNYLDNKRKFRYLTSKREKMDYRSKVTQLVLFLHKLEYNFFLRLNLEQFPLHYKSAISDIIEFLSKFNLSSYKDRTVNRRLNDKELLALTSIIAELKLNKAIDDFREKLFIFEAYLSIGLGIKKNDFSFPKMSKSRINLKGLYHPLLENPVKNDFFTEHNVIVLNGPNMSGKSTFLRSMSLCIYLGNLGIAIPATSGEIPICHSFTIQLNKKDNIKKGLSHFMYDLKTLKNTVTKAVDGNACFGVFDELFNGTNIEDATAIIKSTIKGLSKFDNSFFFISTHIKDLKSLSSNKIEMYFMSCNLKNETPKFTFKIKEGWTDIKIGKLLFEKEGLDKLLE